MQQINDYLKKFGTFINSKNHAHKIVSAEIEKMLGIEIKKQAIEIKNTILSIKESPIIRNTIFYNKKKLLENFKKLGLKISDIN